MPTLAWWPGTIAPGRSSDHPGAFWDCLATFAELAGAPLSEPTDGLSFVPVLLGKDQRG